MEAVGDGVDAQRRCINKPRPRGTRTEKRFLCGGDPSPAVRGFIEATEFQVKRVPIVRRAAEQYRNIGERKAAAGVDKRSRARHDDNAEDKPANRHARQTCREAARSLAAQHLSSRVSL